MIGRRNWKDVSPFFVNSDAGWNCWADTYELSTTYPCLKKILPRILRWLAKEISKETSRKLKKIRIVWWRINTFNTYPFSSCIRKEINYCCSSVEMVQKVTVLNLRGGDLGLAIEKHLVREVKFWNSLSREMLKFAPQEVLKNTRDKYREIFRNSNWYLEYTWLHNL